MKEDFQKCVDNKVSSCHSNHYCLDFKNNYIVTRYSHAISAPIVVLVFVKVVTFSRLGLKDSTLAQQLRRQLYPSHLKGRNTH